MGFGISEWRFGTLPLKLEVGGRLRYHEIINPQSAIYNPKSKIVYVSSVAWAILAVKSSVDGCKNTPTSSTSFPTTLLQIPRNPACLPDLVIVYVVVIKGHLLKE